LGKVGVLIAHLFGSIGYVLLLHSDHHILWVFATVREEVDLVQFEVAELVQGVQNPGFAFLSVDFSKRLSAKVDQFDALMRQVYVALVPLHEEALSLVLPDVVRLMSKERVSSVVRAREVLNMDSVDVVVDGLVANHKLLVVILRSLVIASQDVHLNIAYL